ncbi:MAG: flagellar motor stator protein MotA [Armatimonadetes bacterium]|nr:flagellar motor stator protein MotA [Armatimonadota bacterium]
MCRREKATGASIWGTTAGEERNRKLFVLIGFAIVLGGVLGGYVLHHGPLGVLFQPTEFLIIGGACVGSIVVMSPMPILKKLIGEIKFCFTNGKETTATARDRLVSVYRVLRVAQYDGATGLEKHIERPKESEIFKQNPAFLKDHHGLEFFCDTMKVIMLGSVPPHQIGELTELILKTHEDEAHQPISVLQKVSDALPGLGIVAAVLGIVITMQHIDGDPGEIGHNVAVALVGTLLGVLACYGFVGPMAARLEFLHREEHDSMKSLQACMVAYANGSPPQACVEFGRAALPSHCRPGFDELEKACRNAGKAVPAGAEGEKKAEAAA